MARFWYIMVGILFPRAYQEIFSSIHNSALIQLSMTTSYLHFNPPRVIHQSDANVHAAATKMDRKPYSTLVQKKLHARKAPQYFPSFEQSTKSAKAYN